MSAHWFSVLLRPGVGRLRLRDRPALVDDATGLATAFVTALLPMHVYYSQFVRWYSLLMLLVALDLAAVIAPRATVTRLGRLHRRRHSRHSHYYFVIFLVTSFAVAWLYRCRLWTLAPRRRLRRHRPRRSAADLAPTRRSRVPERHSRSPPPQRRHRRLHLLLAI